MKKKCRGLMGSMFGHKWFSYSTRYARDAAVLYVAICFPEIEQNSIPTIGSVCQRCGAVKGQ